jgi:predicted nucleic acid-binding protein
VILDSNYLGALVDNKPSALELAEEFEQRDVPTRVPTAVVWESYSGVASVGSVDVVDELRGLYERFLASRSTTDLTDNVARRAGTLNGRHMASDELPELDGVDSIVAAHGLVLDEPVVSNDRAFQDVDGLDVVLY